MDVSFPLFLWSILFGDFGKCLLTSQVIPPRLLLYALLRVPLVRHVSNVTHQKLISFEIRHFREFVAL